jgi:glycosyltransferase involved in cell wall biosynthesis
VPNAVDTNCFSPGSGDGDWLDRLAKLQPAGGAVVRIGLVATYALWKGHDVFIEAARLIAAKHMQTAVRFYIVGGPIYQTRGSQWTEAELQKRGELLHKSELMGFVGFQSDIREVYRALDIVVHASTRPEPFGLTIAEAMSCGRPVIVTQAGGACELFVPNHDAVGVPAGDAPALASAIIDLVNDPEKRCRIAEQARLSALEHFQRERLGPQIIAAYRRFGAFIPSSLPQSPPPFSSAGQANSNSVNRCDSTPTN